MTCFRLDYKIMFSLCLLVIVLDFLKYYKNYEFTILSSMKICYDLEKLNKM